MVGKNGRMRVDSPRVLVRMRKWIMSYKAKGDQWSITTLVWEKMSFLNCISVCEKSITKPYHTRSLWTVMQISWTRPYTRIDLTKCACAVKSPRKAECSSQRSCCWDQPPFIIPTNHQPGRFKSMCTKQSQADIWLLIWQIPWQVADMVSLVPADVVYQDKQMCAQSSCT